MIKNKISFEEAKEKSHFKKEGFLFSEYNEKSIHSILKNYFEDDENKKEVKKDGFILDIFNEYGIIEIQTRNFDKLKKKLDAFLDYFDFTIVYPIIENKKLVYLDSNIDKNVKMSPKHMNTFSSFLELYKIKPYLKHKNLHFHFVYLNAIELKKVNNNEKIPFDKLPLEINREEEYYSHLDFKKIINEETTFSAKSFSKNNHLKLKEVRMAFTCLKYLGIIEVVDKKNREYIYRKV